jgi:tyrosine-protein phosphatase YwqE
MILKEAVFKLQTKGYKPVLAHPERYPYFHKSLNDLQELHNTGVLLQLNLLSLSGYYSKQVRQMAKKLLQENLISLIGSDCHNPRQLVAVSEVLNSSEINPLAEINLLNNSL